MAERGAHGGWRSEWARGVVLFGAVLVVGFTVVGVGRAVSGDWVALARWIGPFEMDGWAGRTWEPAFRWAGRVNPGDRVYVRNTNGPVTVETAAGESLLVVAERTVGESSPDVVRIEAVRHAGGVTICALWDAREAMCGAEGDYQLHHTTPNDLGVRFAVFLPRGVALDVSTVNGALALHGASGPVTARTVNGAIEGTIRSVPFSARTVNGGITVTLEALPPGADAVELATVNGSVVAQVARGAGAEVEARTFTGRVESDFPGRRHESDHRWEGRIGPGGPPLALRTVNGSVEVRAAVPEPPVPPDPPVPPTRREPAAAR